jgi:peroxiredoxin
MIKLLAFPIRVPAALRLWLVSILLVATTPCIADQPYRLRIGDKAPDIQLARLDGGQLRLSQLRRQALAVTFYSPYCEPCQRELPILARIVARVGHDTGATVTMVVIVSEGRPDAAVVKKLGSDPIWLLDENQVAKSAFDPRTLPSTFIFGSDRIVRNINRGIGPQYETRVEDWLRKLVGKTTR